MRLLLFCVSLTLISISISIQLSSAYTPLDRSKQPRANGLTSTTFPNWKTLMPPAVQLLLAVCPSVSESASLQSLSADIRDDADEVTTALYNVQCNCEHRSSAQPLRFYCVSPQGREVVVTDNFFIQVLICASWCGVEFV